MCAKRLKIIKNGFTLLEWLKSLRKGLNIWEMAKICGKWLTYLRKG